MRDLDTANASLKSTAHVFYVSLIIPFFMGFGAWALATGAAPGLAIQDNYLEIFAIGIVIITTLLLPAPYLFHWNWETKYFGAGLLAFGTGAIMGVFPILCIGLYSTFPPMIRLAFLLLEGGLIVWWCLRFVKLYRFIYNNKKFFNYIYVEEATAVYFIQQADKRILGTHLKFNQLPGTTLIVTPMLIALAIMPYAAPLSKIFGIPFIHIFLAIGATPINLIFLGLSTKAFLNFYYYPLKIKRMTKKSVYIDKSSAPPKHINLES